MSDFLLFSATVVLGLSVTVLAYAALWVVCAR